MEQTKTYKEFLYKDDSRLLDEERYIHEHAIPAANRLLSAVVRGGWIVLKEVIRTAVKVPGWFVRVNSTPPNMRMRRNVQSN